jgi:paraquat-inducible protein A
VHRFSHVTELAICEYCDTVHRRPASHHRGKARCVTCDSPLFRGDAGLSAMLAVTVTAAIALVIANSFPLVYLVSNGVRTSATIWQSIMAAYDGRMPVVAVIIAATLVVAPVAEIGLLLWVLVPLRLSARPPGFTLAMRALRVLRPWRLVEVFLLGVVVALVKLTVLATATPGYGVFGIAVMVLALTAVATCDRSALWRRAAELAEPAR